MDSPDTSLADWAKWALGAIAGAVIMLVSVVKAWVGIKHTAEDGLAMARANAAEIGELKVAHATANANHEALVDRLDELREGHKEMLSLLRKSR